jgi:nucleotidyltransferase substrate binding protein (TIGR01987 family)
MENHDIRWKQRFINFEKAFLLLKDVMGIKNLSVAERAGLIQFFEMAFELSWKLLKDFEEEEGFVVKSPRDAIKQAYQADLISEGHVWMGALKDRNLTTHTYHEQTALEVEERIRNDYFPMLEALYIDFKNRALK